MRRKRKPIVVEPVADAVRRLRAMMDEYEVRYERTAEQMLEDLQAGRFPETADVSRWLTNYQALRLLEGRQNGHTTGTPSTTT